MFRVLGALQVDVDGVSVDVPGVLQRALLASLLLAPNTVVPADRLAEILWGDASPVDPRNALQNQVARLRRLLVDDGTLLVTRAPGYLLAIGPGDLDAARFERACTRARSELAEAPRQAAARLREALALWRGQAWGDQSDGPARADALRLEELRRSAHEDLVAAWRGAGELDRAIAEAQALVVADPLRERPVQLLIETLAVAGRTADALSTYRRHREVVEEELGLEPSASLRDLEARVLRGEVARSASTVPAVADVAPMRRHLSLPWRPSALLGREAEVSEVLDALRVHRVTTLVGPGGVGKTRLAVEVAHRMADTGARTWWVDLVPIGADRVVDAVATTLGIPMAAEGDRVDALAAALGATDGLLVLDNAEHVIASVAAIVEQLVARTTGLRVLATSRERLALDEEVRVDVAPLAVPEGADRDNAAVQLFLTRWRAGSLESTTDDDVVQVAATCRHLDGLPLAIELGAAQAGVLGLHEVADRLGERLDLLSGGRRTADVRHRTLRAVVDWSVDLLTDHEVDLFTRLAVFPGTFTLDQAEAVCTDDRLARSEVAPSLARLVEQSLVQRVHGRYGMLETLHQYATARLEATDEVDALTRRHAVDTAERLARYSAQLWTPHEAEAAAALTRLLDDLHAAWAYAAGRDQELTVQLAADVYDLAYYRQHLPLMDWGMHVADLTTDHPRLPAALATAATACWTRGRLDDARVLAERGVALAGGDTSLDAVPALDVLADLVMFEGRIDYAVALYRRARELHRARGHEVEALTSHVAGCQARTYGPGAEAVVGELRGLVDEAEAHGCPSLVAFAHFSLGEALVHTEPDAARAAYLAAVDHGNAAGSRLFVMIARAGLLAVVADHDPPGQARAAFADVLDQWERIGNEALQWWTLLSVVVLLGRSGMARPAAVIAGAVRAATKRRRPFASDTRRLDAAVDRLGARLGDVALTAALAEGAGLDLRGAVANARDAIAATS